MGELEQKNHTDWVRLITLLYTIIQSLLTVSTAESIFFLPSERTVTRA